MEMKNNRVYLRIKDDLKNTISAIAGKRGLTVSAYIRVLIYEDIKLRETDPEFLVEIQAEKEKIKLKGILYKHTLTAYFFLNKIERFRDLYAKSMIYGTAFPVELIQKMVQSSLLEYNLLSPLDREYLKLQKIHFEKFLDHKQFHQLLEFKIADHMKKVRGQSLC